jgi:membrane-associated protein
VLESILDLVTASSWTYLILFGVSALDAVFPIVPSEASVIAAGVLAAQGRLELLLVIAAAAAGAWVGDNSSYLAGRKLGRPITRRFFSKPKARRRLEWARHQLDVRGWYIIIVARFIPGGRTATTFTAGLVGYPWKTHFAPLTVLAALVWATYAGLIGYLGGRVFVEQPLYGLVLAFALAGTIVLAVEVSRRVRHG